MSTTPFDPDRWIAAWRFVAAAHAGQTMPGSELPYLTHVGMVAMEVAAAVSAEPQHDGTLAVLCALLHDCVEDTDVELATVEETFGADVAAGVSALTKDETLPKPERMPDSLRRIREQPRSVWIVKLADRITNLQRPPAHWSTDKARRYRMEAMRIREALGEASPYLSGRIDAKIAAYEEFIR